MTEDTNELRKLADAATPGPWQTIRERVVEDDSFGTIVTTCTKDDARFIAAANPTAILSLLDRLAAMTERAEKAETRAREEHDMLRSVAHALGVCHCWDFGCEPSDRETLIASAKRVGDEELRLGSIAGDAFLAREELGAAIERAEKAERERDARPNLDESDCAALLGALAGDVVQPDLGWFGRITDELAACRKRGSR